MFMPSINNLAQLVADDPRADGGQRQISIAADAIAIDRRVGGVAMRLALPVKSFRGVSLALLENDRGAFYRVVLDHADPDLRVTLAELVHEREIGGEWRAWAEFFQLPRIAFGPGGGVIAVDLRLGALDLGAVQPRKRGWPMKGRRSAISAKRTAGAKGRVQVVYRHEREIICYE